MEKQTPQLQSCERSPQLRLQRPRSTLPSSGEKGPSVYEAHKPLEARLALPSTAVIPHVSRKDTFKKKKEQKSSRRGDAETAPITNKVTNEGKPTLIRSRDETNGKLFVHSSSRWCTKYLGEKRQYSGTHSTSRSHQSRPTDLFKGSSASLIHKRATPKIYQGGMCT